MATQIRLGRYRLGAPSAVTTSSTQTLAGAADIRNTTARTLTGQAGIKVTTTKLLVCQSYIVTVVSQTLSGQAMILGGIQTLCGSANVKKRAFLTLSGHAQIIPPIPVSRKTRIRLGRYRLGQTTLGVSQSRTLSGQSFLVPVGTVLTMRTLAGQAVVRSTTLRLQTGSASIQATTTKTLSGQAYVGAIDTTAPTQPTGLTITGSSMTWAASTDDVAVVSYLVQRCTGGGCTSFITVSTQSSSTLTYTDASLPPGTYCYRIIAVDNAGNQSAPSAVVCKTIAAASSNQPLTGQANIQPATSATGINLGQTLLQVLRHGGDILLGQTLLEVVTSTTETDMNVICSQVNLRVAVPWIGTKSYAFNEAGHTRN
ncbi:MAG TPA: fibronectin type III domain-containing protein [Bryobacteraceae bacterium]|jgi:hypothetical protein